MKDLHIKKVESRILAEFENSGIPGNSRWPCYITR